MNMGCFLARAPGGHMQGSKENMRLLSRSCVFALAASLALGAACACQAGDGAVRLPSVAGQFYPSDPIRLRLAIQGFLDDAPVLEKVPVAGIIVPHAGYIYSGQIAADAYRQVQGQPVELVVILGTNHTVPGFRGISILPAGSFRTPLGDALIDETAAKALLAQDPDCLADEAPQKKEHSVEVQVPFIQVLFPKARILPVVIGEPDLALCTRFGEALARTLKGRHALVVASSDLSHYPSGKDAARIDLQTLEAAAKLDPAAFEMKTRALLGNGVPNLATCACGEGPILALMAAARKLGSGHGTVVSYANSGDTIAGDENRTVGYGSILLSSGPIAASHQILRVMEASGDAAPLQSGDKKSLLKVARDSIERYLKSETVQLVRNTPARLQICQGVFVTLKKNGELRGCIGHMAEDTPVALAVGRMALQSAFNDQRFSPLKVAELKDVLVEISVLTPMKQVSGPEAIIVGRDGVLIRKGGRSAVFLPQVAPENHWGKEEMLDHLSLKAGLPPGSWKKDTRFFTFRAEVFDESQFK
jgi:MEMO1 family protein